MSADMSGDANDGRSDASAPPAAAAASAVSLAGIAASPGITAGPALVYRPAGEPRAAEPTGAPVDAEAERRRLRDALAAAAAELRTLARDVARDIGESEAGIFEAQALMLDDPTILERAEELMGQGMGASDALARSAEEQAQELAALPDPVWQARAADIRDAARRAARHLAPDAPTARTLPELIAAAPAPVIVVADDLAPSDTARMRGDRVLGIALARGGATSHAAILARALGIPAVVGLGDAALADLHDGDPLVVDGLHGVALLHPDPAELDAARERMRAEAARRAVPRAEATGPGRTQDGHPVPVLANVGSEAEARAAAEAGAEGIGLLRTEFLFAGRASLPDEHEQAELYAAIIAALGPTRGPVIIRTLDAGADKSLPALADLTREHPVEANPALGVRGIRLQLAREALLATQLRGIVRAAARTGADVRVMLPMVATLNELRHAGTLLAAALADLAAQGIAPPRPLPLGIMVETPAAVLSAEAFAREAAFFSVGTNDLTQYVMAADRLNPHLAGLAQPLQPAVLRALAAVARAARGAGREVGVCGEMAGDPLQALLLVGLGIAELSMAPASISAIKEALAAHTVGELTAAADRALASDTLADVRQVLTETLRVEA